VHSVPFSALSMRYPQRKALTVRTRNCRLLDQGYNAIAMTPGLAAMLCPGFCTGSQQKRLTRSKRLKYCGSIRTLRSLPDHGVDVCEVWFRSVQKCGFV